MVDVDKELAAETRKGLGKMMESDSLINGRIGVKGLLHFDFTMIDKDGNKVCIPGYARVREHPDPDRAGNSTRVYT